MIHSKVWKAGVPAVMTFAATVSLGHFNTATAMEPYGVGSHWNEASKYAKIKEAGVQMIRLDISWYHVQPTETGGFNWTSVDNALNTAQSQGLQVLAVLGYTNNWASSDPTTSSTKDTKYAPKEQYDAAWSNYVNQVVTRYSSKVTAWEIWNEPDHYGFLKNGPGTWTSNHFPSETAETKRRLQYKHLVDLALQQAGLASKNVTTSGFAFGGSTYDAGFIPWLQTYPGWLNQFKFASYHAYGYSGYNRLVDCPTYFRNLGTSIGKSWTHWITEHGINQPPSSSNTPTAKQYLIRSYAVGLSQANVTKIFWFRAGYDPDHFDFFDQSGNTTVVWAAYKTLTSKWPSPTSVAAWQNGNARGAIATLPAGNRVAIVWNDTAGTTLNGLGLSFSQAYNKDGNAIASNSALTGSPVFLNLIN